jgi:hypothetical protein
VGSKARLQQGEGYIGGMLLQGRVPTASEAIQYFRDMAAGRLPKRGKGRRRKAFTGSWYTSRSHPYPPAKLVTPVAMDIAQAKAKLRRIGQKVTLPKIKQKKKPQVKGQKGKMKGGGQKGKKKKAESRDNFT